MPDNFIVFTLNGVEWPLSRVCFTASGVFIVVSLVLLAVVLIRYGRVRELSGSEAASVAMHAGEVGSVDRAVTRHGPAAGREVRVSMSIGDLRAAYRAKNWFRFFALPLSILLMWNSFGLVFFGSFLMNRDVVALVMAFILSLPMTAIMVFCWWAAIYTDLQ